MQQEAQNIGNGPQLATSRVLQLPANASRLRLDDAFPHRLSSL